MLIVTSTDAGAARGFLGGYLSGVILQNQELATGIDVVDGDPYQPSEASGTIVEGTESGSEGSYYGDTIDFVF